MTYHYGRRFYEPPRDPCPAWSLCWRKKNKEKIAKAKKERRERKTKRLLSGTVPRRRAALSQCLAYGSGKSPDKCTCALNSGGKWVTDMNELKKLGHATGEGSAAWNQGGACIIPRDKK